MQSVIRSTALRSLMYSRRPKVLSLGHGRLLSTSQSRPSKHDEASRSSAPGASGSQEGQSARTDKKTNIPYPRHGVSQEPVRGHGGRHFKPTLASFSLEGRVAVVTGAARGLGMVMAQGLMTSGADIAIVDMNTEGAKEAAEKMVIQFKDDNPEADRVPSVTAHFCDVSSPESVQQTVSEVLSSHSKIDVLVTAAGFTENFDAISYPHERMKKLWGVNVDGTYLFAVEVAKHLIERESPGSIVFIGSMSGSIVNVPQPQAPYNASKAAVRHLAATLAVEWAEKGIRVNCISPGYMLTALTKEILDKRPDFKKTWTSLIPTGKMGQPEDLMGVAVFLASDASLYVTGADLRVDGGYTVT